MSKYDFARRLKRMVEEECKIVKAEGKLAKKSGKCYEQISSLKTMLILLEQELAKYRNDTEKLKCENEQLEKFKEREENRMRDLMQNVDQKQAQYQQRLEQHIEQRRLALMQINSIRSIKMATQTYVNLNALPELIQGVSINEKENSSEWKPFCIDPLKHTQKEVQDIIWQDKQTQSVHKDTWETLIMGDILQDMASRDEQMESANLTAVV